MGRITHLNMGRNPVQKQKKNRWKAILLIQLRRKDSNLRPLGYEPNELPTAPLRGLRMQRYLFFFKYQIYFDLFLFFLVVGSFYLKFVQFFSKGII